jgi:two-component system response regulator YesN
MVVDDERPVVDGITLMVERELGAEFEVAASAASGREAIERWADVAPDIVLMDVSMPGLSGIETIRELRRRGSTAAFILVTAYERFDIAREAVELGIRDYLLKPVSREALARSLRGASVWVDRVVDSDSRVIENRERVERLLPLSAAALVQSIMLGDRREGFRTAALAALGIAETDAVAMAASFNPAAGSADPDAEVLALHARLHEALRYRSKAIIGPLVARTCMVLLPCRGEEDGDRKERELAEIVAGAFGREKTRGLVRTGFGRPRPWAKVGDSWAEALGSLADLRADDEGVSAVAPGFAADDEFLSAILEGNEARASALLETLLGGFTGGTVASPRRVGRVAVLFGHAGEVLARRGLLDDAEAEAFLDLGDLCGAPDAGAFALAARSRFARLLGTMKRQPRHSPQVARTLAYIRENYRKPIGLEAAADFVDISPNRLSHLLVEETGRGFSDILIDYRIERAKEKLLEPGATVKDVSLACGYPDPNYFSRLFKKVTGHTPSGWASTSMENAND